MVSEANIIHIPTKNDKENGPLSAEKMPNPVTSLRLASWCLCSSASELCFFATELLCSCGFNL